MNTAVVQKKQTAFRLDGDLIERLRVKARRENRSLNNYVSYLFILPLVCCTLVLNAKTVSGIESTEDLSVQQNPVRIEIRMENDKPVYYINGEETNIDELGGKIGAQLKKNIEFEVVQLVVDRNVKWGILSDLNEELGKLGAQNIEFFTVTPNEKTESVPFDSVEVKPTFQGGGPNEFSRWVAKHLVYPARAKATGRQGKAIVKFTVNENGKVTNVSVLKSTFPEFADEAIRVVSSSPDWKPGEKDGKTVSVTYTFPVFFQLSNPSRVR